MEKVKVSFHTKTRSKSTASHNDRTMYKNGYKVRDENLDKWNRVKDLQNSDLFKSCNYKLEGYEHLTNQKIEDEFFKLHHKEHLDRVNKKYKAKGKKSKIKTMREAQNAIICEDIIQVGNSELVNADNVRLYAQATMFAGKERLEQLRKAGVTIFSSNVHLDEDVPHMHIRYAYYDFEEHKSNKTKLLRENGIVTESKNTKYDNALKTYTEKCREEIYDCVENLTLNNQRVFEVDRNPIDNEVKQKSIKGYKAIQKRLKASVTALKGDPDIKSLESTIEGLEDEIKTLKLRKTNLKSKKMMLETEKAELNNELAGLTGGSNNLNSEVEQLRVEVERAKARKAELERETEELNELRESFNKTNKELRRLYNLRADAARMVVAEFNNNSARFAKEFNAVKKVCEGYNSGRYDFDDEPEYNDDYGPIY